ncbi:hypothetical protein HYV79_05050 [Candidatus Woesearchaeota archaeon]|nr:hypothetical protein [Candidatus Woesearchaeota archaeon]
MVNELVEAIVQMRKDGYSDSEIIQAFSSQGYSPKEIEKALEEANQVSAEPAYYPQAPTPPQPSAGETDWEEVIESIVEDKIRAVTREFSELQSWKERAHVKLEKLEQSVDDLKKNVLGLQKAMLGKVEEYERGLLDVGTELKAMQKVFKEALPELTKNISELSRITKGKKK